MGHGYVYVSVFVCTVVQYCVYVYMYFVGGLCMRFGSVLRLWVLFLFTFHYVCTVRKGEMGLCGNSLSSEASRPQALSRVLRGPFPVQSWSVIQKCLILPGTCISSTHSVCRGKLRTSRVYVTVPVTVQ